MQDIMGDLGMKVWNEFEECAILDMELKSMDSISDVEKAAAHGTIKEFDEKGSDAKMAGGKGKRQLCKAVGWKSSTEEC